MIFYWIAYGEYIILEKSEYGTKLISGKNDMLKT